MEGLTQLAGEPLQAPNKKEQHRNIQVDVAGV